MSQSTTDNKLARSFASYLPPAVVRRILIDPQSSNEPHIDRFGAVVLFADVTGFTELNEQLTMTGPHAAEELTQLLNDYFSKMIELLEAEGGEVVQFSGDALTAIFLGRESDSSEEGLPADRQRLKASVFHAWKAATAMQQAMADFTHLTTSLGPTTLDMKMTIGAGMATGLSVGGMNGHWQYVMAGDPLQQVARLADDPGRDSIALSPEAKALFSEEFVPAQHSPTLPLADIKDETISALRSHVPDIVTHRLMAGQAQWLAEIRSLSILFIGIGGLNYSSSFALDQVQSWVESFQETVYRYEGSLNKLLVDDKGTIGVVLFGAPPRSHEDDALRAVRCALDLQKLAESQGLELAIGITTGQVFAGPVGSDRRREYTVIGDNVNLATRLMQQAGPGDIHADFVTYQATRNNIEWQALLPQTVKGKAATVRIYRPLGLQDGRQISGLAQPLIGRTAELAKIDQAFDSVLAGQPRVICLEGEAGIGKSCLAGAVIRRTREKGLVGLIGNGDALEQQTPYNAWREIFRSYFDLENVTDSSGQQVRVLERLVEIAPELRDRVALLNDLLGLGLPESSLTNSFVPKLRQASLTALLVELLTLWANERPLVLVLEDAQWLDSLSWRLVLQVARSMPDLPVLLVIASRPLEERSAEHPYDLLLNLPQCDRLVLEEMNPSAPSGNRQFHCHAFHRQSVCGPGTGPEPAEQQRDQSCKWSVYVDRSLERIAGA
jgi:class 3 adenylate cyclase